MRNVYEISFTEEELTELTAAYAFAYTFISGEGFLADIALQNFLEGNKIVQSGLASKIQTILKLKMSNAEKTL